jgi:hypothetical protein
MLAAGLASSMAQPVYSLNVVGYYNVTVPANTLVMVGSQLDTTNNTLGSIIPNPPPGSQFYKFDNGWTPYTFDDVDLVWTPNGDATLAPGEGGFFRSPEATTLTFVGEVKQGMLTNSLPIGMLAVRSSIVPQAGAVSALGLAGEAGDQMYTYSGGYTPYTFDDVDLVWTPSEPSLNVGQAFFYKKSPTAVNNEWVRDFTVPE